MKQYRDGYTLIFRAWIRTKDGKIIYARWYGKRAFPVWIKDTDPNETPREDGATTTHKAA